MENRVDRFKNAMVAGFNEDLVDPRELIKQLRRQREADNAGIVRALEIAGNEIALLKSRAASARQTPREPATMPKAIEALSDKLREQSIADSRTRG
jgi:hypothetical protein